MRTICVRWLCLFFALIGLVGTGCSESPSCAGDLVPCGEICQAPTLSCPSQPQARDVALSDLAVSIGTLVPAFQPTTLVYTLQVPGWLSTLRVMPSTTDAAATISVNGMATVASGTAVPIALSGGVTMTAIVVTGPDGAQRSYSIVVTRPSPSYMKASNTDSNDGFGTVLALSGDTLVVGAPLEASSAAGVDGDQSSNGAPGSGAVYVFVRNGASWAQQAYLKASNPESGDNFGIAVSLDGDTLVVGASGEDSGATVINGNQLDNSAGQSGAVYVFVRSNGRWSQQAYLKASNGEAGDRFGASVSVSGNTVAVGAPGEDSSANVVGGNQASNGAIESGAAYVFVRTGSNWMQQEYLKGSNARSGDFFGGAVSLSGDSLAVGAALDAANASGLIDPDTFTSGATYVFVRVGMVWTQQAYLKATNAAAMAYFGSSLSLHQDTLAIGAPGEASAASGLNGELNDRSSPQSGAVYIFVRTAAAWTQQVYVKASNSGSGDRFGSAVWLSDELFAVGAIGEGSSSNGLGGDPGDERAAQSGAAYVFRRTAGVWAEEAYVKASNTGSGDQFGCALAISTDALVIGANQEDSKATGIGGDQANNSFANSGAGYAF